MYTFLTCGIILLLYAWMRFSKKVFYPSVIFCLMWGMNCIFHYLIYIGYINPLTYVEDFDYSYMDTYIIYFVIATIVGFSMAHWFYNEKDIKMNISIEFMDRLLKRYKWVMWLNFYGGLLRIFAMVSLIGFSFYNIIDYRVAANNMMAYTQGGFVGWTFRITAYINILAIIYVSLSGLRAGMTRLSIKETLKMFVLFAPVQLATGGRLFILFFILFFFGCFVLGRGISLHTISRKWLQIGERKTIISMMLIMMPLVIAITLVRGEGGVANLSNQEGSFLDPFSYISDGTMTTDKCMDFFSGGKYFEPAGGSTTFLGSSDLEYQFRAYKHNSNFGSSVYSLIIPLFLDFGYWGSIVVWALLAFVIEAMALKTLSKMTLLRFFIYALLLKMCYESVITNPFAGNIPFFELIVIFTILYKPLFGKLESRRKRDIEGEAKQGL